MFKNLTVRTRLIGGFLMLAVLGAMVALLGIANMSKMHDQEDALYQYELLGLSHIKEANINLIYLGRARGNYLLATTDQERQQQLAMRKKYEERFQDYLAKARPLFVSERAQAIFKDIDATWRDYISTMDRAYSLAATDNLQQRSAELDRALAETRRHANHMDELLSELSTQKEARAKETIDEATATYQASRNFMIFLVLASVLLSLVFGILITRSVTGPLNKAVGIAKAVAGGDLTSRIEVDTTNEIGELLQALKDMNASLVEIVGQVRDGTETIASASQQIATGNMDLSVRTEQQASSLEETASSMEELTSTVKQNADNASQANTLASSAADVALKGGKVVAEVVETMGSINASAKKIADITGVIDGIAFQTNILALNAAVEAARAGEQGRGFAVVASEVRNLAQRSAAAAKEIKALIGDSVQKVDVGARLVDQAGTTMHEIVDGIKHVTDIMAEIAAASREQSSGIDQINLAVSQMDEMTQQNASLVEEAAAAAQSMRDQAGKLSSLVSFFKLDGRQSASAPQQQAEAAPARRPTRDAGRAALQSPVAGRGRLALAGAGHDWEEF